MSSSPILRRLSTSTSTSGDPKEDLINAYEAEEERIINVLSRKLEQLREEKISLENALEAESESHVNRLNRELSLLRARQRGSDELEPPLPSLQNILPGSDPRFPTPEAMLDAMRKENESLRNRVVDMERDYIRIARLNEVYREELIDHRRRLGLSVDNLVGLPGSTIDPFSQPLHRRSASNSPTTSVFPLPSYAPRSALPGVPIPRPPSQLRRQNASQPITDDSSNTTPLTTSPSSSPSPFPFSPVTNTQPASYVSNATQFTTPSSASLHSNPPQPFPAQAPLSLSYPSVPPPSLSSSLGSPTFPHPHSSVSHSPTEVRSTRSSRPCARVAEVGNLRDLSRSRSRRGSLAETHSHSGSPTLNGGGTSTNGGTTGSISVSASATSSASAMGVSDPVARPAASHRVAETGSLGRRLSPVTGDVNER